MDERTLEKIKNQCSAAPLTAGVYFMRDAARTILYIGKARRLRLRLQSYLRGEHDAKTARLMEQVTAIEWQETENEIDALLLESELVRAQRPFYNVRLKDDKRFPFIAVTMSEAFPRVVITRRAEEKRDRYFGPFPDAAGAKRLVVELNRAFRLRRCVRIKKRACLNAQMAVCQGPCAGTVDRARYRADIARCLAILQGRGYALIRSLRTAMRRYSSNLDFEKAATYRDAIAAVESVLTHRGFLQDALEGRRLAPSLRPALLALREALGLAQLPVRLEAYDIANAAGGRHAFGAKVAMAWGKFSRRDYRLYAVRGVAGQDDFAMLAETMRRRLAHADTEPLPELMLIDGGPGQLAAVLAVLAEAKVALPVLALAKREERVYRAPDGAEVTLPDGAKHLLMRLRDEVHRFVNGAYRRRHGANMLHSVLQDVPGLGPARAKRLLAKFSLPELKSRTAEEIAATVKLPLALVRNMQIMLVEGDQ